MYILVTYRDEENQMKNEGARVVTQGFFSPFWDNDPYPWDWEF